MIATTTRSTTPLSPSIAQARRTGRVTGAQLSALLDLAEAADTLLMRLVLAEIDAPLGAGRGVAEADETIAPALDALRLELAGGDGYNRTIGAELGMRRLAKAVCRAN